MKNGIKKKRSPAENKKNKHAKMLNNLKILLCLPVMIIILNCATAQNTQHESRYNFTLKNTLSIFMLNNEKGDFFCIPVQYMGDYQIQSFEFNKGNVQIGGYEISLKRENVNISVYLNKEAEETGGSDSGFNLIYLEENGNILMSNLSEPLAEKEPSGTLNHYYIFIEKYLNDDDIKNITVEYEKGNVYSKLGIEYDLVIDNEDQFRSGIYDDFELCDGTAMDSAWFPPNLNFFKAEYLEKN